mmetsp:Transcript_57012/g.144561  ORF Transcript_57012/g.144561 Transcript_57012/m.144561 type:complete len:210 (+) Transcript_57012:629-1258(+)
MSPGASSFFGGGMTFFGAAFALFSFSLSSSEGSSGGFKPAFSRAETISDFSTQVAMSTHFSFAKAFNSEADIEMNSFTFFSGGPEGMVCLRSTVVRLCFFNNLVLWFSSSHFGQRKALQFMQKTVAWSGGSFSQASHFLDTKPAVTKPAAFAPGSALAFGRHNFGFFLAGSPVSASPNSCLRSRALATSAQAMACAMVKSFLSARPWLL